MCRPSKRSALSGLVIEAIGGRAIGSILPYTSVGLTFTASVSALSPPRPPRPPPGACSPRPPAAPAPAPTAAPGAEAVIRKRLSAGCTPSVSVTPPLNPPRPPPPPARPVPAGATPGSGWKASPPSSRRTAQVLPRVYGRVDVKNSVRPSSDHRGAVLSNAGEVMRLEGPPATGCSHTSAWRLFSVSRTVVTVNAIRLPSGDNVGPATREIRYQSAGVKARPPDCANAGPAAMVRSARAKLACQEKPFMRLTLRRGSVKLRRMREK